ncbi:TOPRIM nucleotidyl transferase/hydrolase domain-containing protein [Nocardia sp. NPDC049737]|uniref:ATP-dependent nuclease n=1 Tax=Nocardia sp. NPDC049737 TaxID=3154358 RepID=UPI00342088B9
MPLQVRLETVTFSDHTVVSLPPAGVLVLVGPNNAGKSQALRDIYEHCQQPRSGRCVAGVTIRKSGTRDDFETWVTNNVPRRRQGSDLEMYHAPNWMTNTLEQFGKLWNAETGSLEQMRDMFVFHANAMNRLTGANSTSNLDYAQEPPVSPLQKAYLDGSLERAFDEISRSAFGLRTVVDRQGGSRVSLRVGLAKPDFTHENGVPDQEYLHKLHVMPLIDDQGDGMKSFMGLMIHVMAGNHFITLVDEPEAFLHPPQARMLGKLLAQRSVDDKHVVIATHSSDIVQGVLNAEVPSTIVRITRNGDHNEASVLLNEDLTDLWNDPLLKHSNVLDGLFHDAVVICEADSDCRLYSAVLDSIRNEGTKLPTSRMPEILFVPSGGKQRLHTLVRALKAVSVPVFVIADFDLLRQKEDINRILNELGEDFSSIEKSYRILDSALRSAEEKLTHADLLGTFKSAIDSMPDPLDRKSLNSLKGLLKINSGWDKVKRTGLAGVPQGDPYRACTELVSALRDFGIFVVPVGELERFAPQVSGHGPSWTSEVLARKLHEGRNLPQLRDFVLDLYNRAQQAAIGESARDSDTTSQ